MDYKKIYCDKWKAAYTSNTVDDSDGACVELRWKDVPLGELFCGPSGVVFTKLYCFKGDPELTKIQAFPVAEKEFNALLKNVETLEYICQLWEEVRTSDLEVDFYHGGQLYARILFTNGSVSFEAHTGNGWETSNDPERLINYSKWFKDRRRDVDIFDDMELIKDLGSMIKK